MPSESRLRRVPLAWKEVSTPSVDESRKQALSPCLLMFGLDSSGLNDVITPVSSVTT